MIIGFLFGVTAEDMLEGIRGELINATRWRTNKKQNIKKPAELQL